MGIPLTQTYNLKQPFEVNLDGNMDNGRSSQGSSRDGPRPPGTSATPHISQLCLPILPRQDRSSLDFLVEELDNLLQHHGCNNILIVGDLNFHLERQARNNLVTVLGFTNHVTFHTHERGGLLDPVLSDIPEERISCQQLGKVGSSDHHAVLAKIHLHVAREKAAPRTIWLWEQAR
ncbi:hypothetical protein E2C01_008781 [Portunus trituberculatus]|uniref:Endonuclease/exonuclease/phosphatase domain-containing protein n=1 Tax=Portunus trituberculatus TaxID=210409 RepID=A0A5B7D532_PORTR|nr:hypothetical protein [Portunus trituberculatus]